MKSFWIRNWISRTPNENWKLD